MPANEDPAFLRRRLQRELRQLRVERRETQAAVATAMDWSPSKVIRIENGAVAVATNDLKVLLAHYGVDDVAVVDQLLKLSRESKRPSPWAQFLADGAITAESAAYFGQEASAQIIRQFEPLILPGLVQTERYMRAILAATGRSGRQIDDAVEARLKRQELFDDAADMPELFFIVDESILHRVVGGAAAMRAQLEHLIEVSQLERVTLQVVRSDAGAYPGLLGPFTLLEFTDDDALLYLESRFEVITREGSDVIGEYLDSFQRMETLTASKPDEFGSIVRSIITEL